MTAQTELDLKDQLLDLDEEEDDETYYYYDDHDNWLELRHKRGDMPGTSHSDLEDYLMQVLFWLFRLEQYGIYRELNFYQTNNPLEKPLYPDLALLKSQKRSKPLSYRLGTDGPPPELVIEIISTKTRSTDLIRKPKRYQQWGVAEYFAYDPRPRRRKKTEPRLWGWRRNQGGVFEEIKAQADGRMWSEQLDSWLVPDGENLKLYDQQGNLRLTKAEALAERLRQLGYDPDKDL
jgi:Uma2 family endonuclease